MLWRWARAVRGQTAARAAVALLFVRVVLPLLLKGTVLYLHADAALHTPPNILRVGTGTTATATATATDGTAIGGTSRQIAQFV